MGYSKETERQNEVLKSLLKGETPEKRVMVGYEGKSEEKTPQERQRELDEKMKEFLAKGGEVTKVKAHKPTKEQLKSWKI